MSESGTVFYKIQLNNWGKNNTKSGFGAASGG